MHRLFWIFCSFLIILTLISAIGGGIRYRENFMDEVLDNMYDNVKDVDPSIMRTLSMTNVVEEEAVVKSVPAPVPVPKPVPPTPTPSTPSTIKGVQSDLSSNYKVIEPFNGNVYATF